MRTTLDIDKPILDELKALKKRAGQGKSLGKLVSELLARSLRDSRGPDSDSDTKLNWQSASMGPKIDIDDKDALYAELDKPR